MTETPKLNILTRDAILASKDISTKTLYIPEWDGHIRIRGFTARERGQYANLITSGGSIQQDRKTNVQTLTTDIGSAMVFAVSCCVIDENDIQLFTPDDLEALAGHSSSVMERIADIILDLSGINMEEEEPEPDPT